MTDLWTRAILSNPATVAQAIRGEKGGAEIEAALPYPARLLRPPPPRALPKNLNPARSAGSRATCQTEDFLHINS